MEQGNCITFKIDNNWTSVPNSVLRDDTLSWKAKGLFAYIMSLPKDWKLYQKELMTHATDGETSFKTGLKELEEHGYLVMYKKSVNGIFEYEYEIIPYPNKKEDIAQKPQEEKGNVKKPRKRIPLLEREPVNDLERIEKAYLLKYAELKKRNLVQTDKPSINWTATRKLENKLLGDYSLEQILKVLDTSYTNDFLISKGYGLNLILSAGMFNQLLNSKPINSVSAGKGVDEYKYDPNCDF